MARRTGPWHPSLEASRRLSSSSQLYDAYSQLAVAAVVTGALVQPEEVESPAPKAPDPFDKELLARLAREAAERSTEVEDPAPSEAAPEAAPAAAVEPQEPEREQAPAPPPEPPAAAAAAPPPANSAAAADGAAKSATAASGVHPSVKCTVAAVLGAAQAAARSSRAGLGEAARVAPPPAPAKDKPTLSRTERLALQLPAMTKTLSFLPPATHELAEAAAARQAAAAAAQAARRSRSCSRRRRRRGSSRSRGRRRSRSPKSRSRSRRTVRSSIFSDTPTPVGTAPASAMTAALALASGQQAGKKFLRMPDSHVKLLVGKGGWTIRHIVSQTGANIQVESPPGREIGLVSVSGNNVEPAIAMIRDALVAKGCFPASIVLDTQAGASAVSAIAAAAAAQGVRPGG
mmetsp:Transcript_94817/g.292323  ORF Transcript_94817/g.292323 Transcript_94817/m.292323 type:complete len:403 (+) Transcript_94817:86-1294(+)